ncbi:MAG: SDR family oxidoreductase [Myxococcales bacterium]|nr:SDR family oxidoreductase [Myxococcales bacterium]
MPSFTGKTVVVLGATGVVGSGICRAFLDQGAFVVAVSRSAGRFDELSKTLALKASDGFATAVGDFKDEASSGLAMAAIDRALAGRAIDHVISSQGFVKFGPPPTQSTAAQLNDALADGLTINFNAAKALLPGIKQRAASFTMVSGGLAHIPPPDPAMWMGTIKNAAVNAFTLGLAAETARDVVRVNTLCIHFGIAPIGGKQNQFGLPAERDSLGLAPAFLAIARGRQKGQVLCLNSWADVDALAKS